MRTSIIKHNSVNYIAIDGKPMDTLAFKSFRPTKNNVGDFNKAGVKIFHVYCSGLPSKLEMPYSLFGETWFGDKNYDFANLDKQIDFFKESAPDGYVFINVHLDVRPWWLQQNEGRPNSFTHLSQIAGDEKWKKDTADYLKALIEHTEAKYDDFVLGYFLLGGTTTEWFSDFDYEASHPIKLAAYRNYMDDQSIEIPTKEELEKPENQIFLDPIKDKAVIDYRKFHHNLIADLVLYYAHSAQEVLNHKKLVGLFFGYILELAGPRIWDAGHLEGDKVYDSPDIDLIATPSSYMFRDFDDAGAYMLLSDSIERRNMMYFASFDHKTFKFYDLLTDKRRLCNDEMTVVALHRLTESRSDFLETREKTIEAMRREFMLRMYKRTGMWWFDMLEGWYYDDGLMEEVAKLTKLSEKLTKETMQSNSEVAVFVSNESLYYVNKCSRINTLTICRQREGLARMGAPYDIFSLNDIDKVNKDKYKVCIFTNAYYLTDEQREYINTEIKKDGRTLVFLGGCDCVSDEGFSLAKMEEMCGFKLSEIDTEETKINAFDGSFGYDKVKNPIFYINEEIEFLGRYSKSRKGGLARKDFGDYKTVFSGIGNLTGTVLREILREAGVFIYAENDVSIYVNSRLIGVYNSKNEYTEIRVKEDGEYTEIFSGKKVNSQNGIIKLHTGEHPAQMLIKTEE